MLPLSTSGPMPMTELFRLLDTFCHDATQNALDLASDAQSARLGASFVEPRVDDPSAQAHNAAQDSHLFHALLVLTSFGVRLITLKMYTFYSARLQSHCLDDARLTLMRRRLKFSDRAHALLACAHDPRGAIFPMARTSF